VTATATVAAPAPGATRRRPARPRLLFLLSAVVAVVLALPLAFLIIEAVQYANQSHGLETLRGLVLRNLTAELLWNTLVLTVAVTLGCAVIGTLAAWVVERTDLPARRVWAVLFVLPVAVPDFAVAFGWHSVFPAIGGFSGSVLIMTLAVYPLVYLPVAASLRNADPAQEEVARSLGTGPVATFWRVTVGEARLAILGGCLLVALVLLAEYGAFEILGYRTFTTEIFTEFNVGYNTPATCALSLVLVSLALVVVVGERFAQGRGRVSRVGPMAARPATRHRLGPATAPVLAGCALLVGLALGVPAAAVVHWLVLGGAAVWSWAVASAAFHTAAYSAGAGLLATAMALPVALLSVRHPGRAQMVLERSTYLVLATPGVVIALALTYFSERDLASFGYLTAWMLIFAYAVMFFPLALVAVRTSLAQAPVALEEVGRSLGRSRLEVLGRVTLPLVGPGLAAAFSLVFLEAVTELTATLVLVPNGSQTLTTGFWMAQTNAQYPEAAPYVAVMVAIAAVPSYVLGRWFDRLPQREPVAA